MLKEFKEFALKGNLIDLAIAFVMGAAFTKLSTSFIEDLVMPFIGKITGGLDFSNKFIALAQGVNAEDGSPIATLAEAKKVNIPVFAYGNFITVGINFLIVAFVMFLVVKSINKLKRAEPAAPAVTPAQELLLTEIRDLLKARN